MIIATYYQTIDEDTVVQHIIIEIYYCIFLLREEDNFTCSRFSVKV